MPHGVKVQVLSRAPRNYTKTVLLVGFLLWFFFGDFEPPPQACKVRTASGSSETDFPTKAVLSIAKSGVRQFSELSQGYLPMKAVLSIAKCRGSRM